jgi:AmmeMemoRadiSam system protein B
MRKAVVRGQFYPETSKEINSYIENFDEVMDKNIDDKAKDVIFQLKPKAIVVPHAGYIYSGFTANFAYRILENKNYKRAIVIGPSHNYEYDGISVTLEESYETPFGDLKIDTNFSKRLMSDFGVLNLEEVHIEHSTETQMPFIKKYLPNVEVVEMIYSKYSSDALENVIEYLIQDEDNLLVISSDLSHFYNLEIANSIDINCIEAIHNLSLEKLSKCEACGKIGIESIIKVSKNLNLKSFILDYRTSADISGDKEKVVGYLSALFV